MTGSCVCGAVSVSIKEKPAFIHDCSCSLCRKVGAAWGYFSSSEVRSTGPTFGFIRTDKELAGAEVHACKNCGATTHFVLADSFKKRNPTADQVGVNMRIFDPYELDGVEVRFPNGRDWPGEGPFDYRRSSMTISKDTPW